MMINIKEIDKQKYLHAVWCLLLIWVLWQCGSVLTRSVFLSRRVQKTLKHYKKSPEQNEPAHSAKADRPQGRQNLFVALPKSSMPKCTAVLGDEALINGKWYKVGSEAGGAKILAVNPESVKILWEEKEHTLMPFDVQVQYAEKPRGGGTPASASKPPPPPQPVEPTGEKPENGRPQGGFGMTDERQRQMRERYENASPEEQEEMRRQMRERLGRGGRGRRGG